MIWGMYLPRGGGPYGPDGDYEGPVDIYGDGWLHRLIKYGCEELSDEQRAFYGDGRRYAFCAIKKFHKENGYRGPSPDDRIVQPIEKHEPPLFFQLKRGYRELSSIISLPGRIWAVDESVKQIIERLEPSLHSFYPVEIRMRRGKVYPVGLCALFGHRFTVATTTASVSGVVQSGWPSRRSIFVNRTGNILRSPLQKGRHDGRP